MAKVKLNKIRKPSTGTKSKSIQVDENLNITEKNEQDLLQHLKNLMLIAKPVHDTQVQKFKAIDTKVYGKLVLDEDDQKREQDNRKGYGIKPVDTSIPLTQVQMDEAVTYFIEVLSTEDGLYGARAHKDKQQVANGFAALMNHHSHKFKHTRELNKFLFNCLKYNFGAVIPEWAKVYGNTVENANEAQTTPAVKSEQLIYEGNKLTNADPYNFWYDLSCDPTELAAEGEFFATVEVKTPFKLKKMAEEKMIYGVDRFINENSYPITYYEEKPKIRADVGDNSSNKSWVNILSASTQDIKGNTENAAEIVKFYVWLPGKEFGLDSKDNEYAVYKIWMVSNKYIVKAQKMNNAHGMLPIGIGMPWEDGFKEDSLSYGELLLPFQIFASAQMNVHQKSNRKSLYGLLFFNKNVINLDDNYDPIAGKIPVNASPEVDLKKAIHMIRDVPETANTLKDIEAVIDIMQTILPTDILRQVAGLDRATQYQAAAVVQGSNRRNLKITKLIEDQAFSTVKDIQMYNILQYQQAMDILTPEGELVEVNPGQFRDAKLEFTISDGLRGLDRLAMVMHIKEVLNSILQSQHANQQIDVVGVINYYTSLLGDRTDFSQFKFKSQLDMLPPEQKQIAYQLLQQYMQQQQQGGGGQAA